jgi:hypothetical protein
MPRVGRKRVQRGGVTSPLSAKREAYFFFADFLAVFFAGFLATFFAVFFAGFFTATSAPLVS